MQELSDEKLVELHKKGDITAFEQLYLRYNKLINAFSRSYYLAGGDEDDLKQEGMLGLVYAIKTFDETKGKFGTFAYLCIRSRVLNAINLAVGEKHKALNNSVSITDVVVDLQESLCDSPENVLIGAENLKELIEKIKELLSKFEISVFEKYIEGLNYREIAKELNVDSKKVDNALSRIKDKSKKIRSKLCRI